VFENRVLRRISGPKWDQVRVERRRLHNEEFYDLYSSPNVIRVIKSRIMRWTDHVQVWRTGEAYTGFWWGNLRERDQLEDLDIDGKIILKWVLRKWIVGAWTRLIWTMRETGGQLL